MFGADQADYELQLGLDDEGEGPHSKTYQLSFELRAIHDSLATKETNRKPAQNLARMDSLDGELWPTLHQSVQEFEHTTA
jgi:hypothetical protein